MRFAAWILRHARAVLVAAGLIVAGSIAAASRLELRTSIAELLPARDPRVAALGEVERRMGQLSALVVVVRSPDAETNLAWAKAFAARVEERHADLVERALWGAPGVWQYFRANHWLYADEADLAAARDRIGFEILRAKNPFYVALDEPPAFAELRRRIEARRGRFWGLPGGVFQSESGDLVAVVVLPARDLTSADDQRIVGAARQEIDELPHPGLTVELTGEIEAGVEERRAIRGDVAVTSTMVGILVGAVVWLYFGRPRALPLMALPALAGLAVAMGVAGLAFGGLNASTVFLGAIIVGNGINFPIVTQARYEEERARGRPVGEAIRTAVARTARATSLAAFAAAVAYASLALTGFRGFSQFGVIGAIGMAMAWVGAMTILPALLWVIDRGRDGRPARIRRANFGRPFARAAERAPFAVLALGAVLTAGAVTAIPRWLRDPFEYDFRKLRSARNAASASSALDQVFGRALSPSVVLTDTVEEARAAASELRARGRAPGSPIAQVLTAFDLLPGSPEEQRRKLALVDEIRGLLDDPALRILSDERQREIAEWRPPANLAPIGFDDLPPLALRPFREQDGTVGRVVLVYPPLDGFSVSDGHDLLRLARAIEEVELAQGRRVHATGRAVIFAAMIQSIAHDGPMATVASFAAVALLTVLFLRRGAVFVLTALLLGVLWMIGTAALVDVKINFLNFIALPITFGIGADYATNIYLRYRTEGRGSIGRALRSTGGAVALNSSTTIIGYGSLLGAHNRALVSFGALAILGEIACLAAGLLVLPALLALRDRRPTRAGAAERP